MIPSPPSALPQTHYPNTAAHSYSHATDASVPDLNNKKPTEVCPELFSIVLKKLVFDHLEFLETQAVPAAPPAIQYDKITSDDEDEEMKEKQRIASDLKSYNLVDLALLPLISSIHPNPTHFLPLRPHTNT